MTVLAGAHAEQQRDGLCGPFHGARVLLEAGVADVDQDLVAVHAGTTVPPGPEVPPGAASLRDYRCSLTVVDAARAGTSAGGLAGAIESLSDGALECVPLTGRWSAVSVGRLVEAAPRLGAWLIANLRTGRLWHSRPPACALLAELAGTPVDPEVPSAEWDVGHFVSLVRLVRGDGGSLVVVRDSYPSIGWMGHHLQPPRVVADALERGDGREGGVLAVVRRGGAGAVGELAGELELETRLWQN